MKCSNVQSVIVEYAEGALCPADEMCIDIHLIQCEECRAELSGLRDLLGDIAHKVHACDATDDPIAFLDRFHALELESAPAPTPPVQRVRLPLFRFAAAALVVALILSSGLTSRTGSGWFAPFGAPVVEAQSKELSSANWSPYVRSGLDFNDLDRMGLVGSIESRPGAGGD